MSLILSYLRKHRKLLLISIVLATINQVFSLVNPQIFRILIDQFVNMIPEHTASTYIAGLIKRSLIGVWAAMVSRLAKTFQDYYVNLMSQTIWSRVYAQWVSHAFFLPYRTFEDRQSWALLDKLLKARTDIQNLLTSMIDTVFLTSIWMLIVIIYAFWVHWIVWVCFLAMVPLLAFTTYRISLGIKDSQKKIVAASSALSGATVENIKNVALIKSLWLEQQEIDHLTSVNEQLISLEIDKLKLIKTLSFTQGTLINFLRTLLQWVMLRLIFTWDITLWEFFSLLFYSFLMFNPLYQLPTVAKHFQEASASSKTLQEIFALEQEHHTNEWIKITELTWVRCEDVSFGYWRRDDLVGHPDDDQTRPHDETDYQSVPILALSNITRSLSPWETIAFVGPSGSGKSTMIKMLSGLYQPDEGHIFVNELDASTIAWTSVKQKLWVVTQDTQLFTGTVRDNLLFVQPEATDDACWEVLQQASLADFIRENKLWLDARIWEWWLKLSGGQKQRLAIARALLRRPDLLIFDEATSALDSLIEWEITETIKHITADDHDMMTILVAHRLSTIMHADRIYVLEKGAIVESWSHDQLVAEKWLYYALWRQQVGEKG